MSLEPVCANVSWQGGARLMDFVYMNDPLVILQPHSSYCLTGYEIRVACIRKGESKTECHVNQEWDRGRVGFWTEIMNLSISSKPNKTKTNISFELQCCPYSILGYISLCITVCVCVWYHDTWSFLPQQGFLLTSVFNIPSKITDV